MNLLQFFWDFIGGRLQLSYTLSGTFIDTIKSSLQIGNAGIDIAAGFQQGLR